MIDIKPLKEEVKRAEALLKQKQNELSKAKTYNLKEAYGKDFKCDKCAYSCSVMTGDYHTYCYKNRCILCVEKCHEYMPENELSKFIRAHYHYKDSIVDTLNDLFDVDDILWSDGFHDKAIKVLKVLKNTYEV